MVVFLLVLLVVATILSLLGVWVSTKKNRSEMEGFVLGFLFGPFGVLIAALLPNQGSPPPELNESNRWF